MSDLSSLRAEVRRLHRNANNKLSRLESDGFRIRYTALDPRRNLKKVDKYNKTQLNSYAEVLRSFNSRSNKFLKGATSDPIPISAWNEYKRIEAQYNKRKQERYSQIGHIFDPASGVTIKERDETFLQGGRRRIRQGNFSPYTPINRRTPAGVMGVKGLKILTQNLKERTSKKRLTADIKRQQFNARELLSRLGDSRLNKRLSKLSNSQFDLLWNSTNFAEDASQVYSQYLYMTETQGRQTDDMAQIEDLLERIEWARAQNV